MARVVRKVSNKAVAGQKKQKGILNNKLFWIIGSVVVVIGLALGITLGVVLNKKDSSEEPKVDYFATCEEVDFTIGSYEGIKNYVNTEYKNPQNNEELHTDYAFVFTYDSTSFFPDSTDEDNYVASHKELLDRIIDLQKHVDEAVKNGKKIKMFIVDTSVGNNNSVYTNELFGSLYTDDATSYSPMLICIEAGEYKAYYEEEIDGKNNKIYISSNNDENGGTTENYIKNTLINRVTNYILNKIN